MIGPNYSHFAEAIELVQIGGCISVNNPENFQAILNELISDSLVQKSKGNLSAQFVQKNKGAVAKIMSTV